MERPGSGDLRRSPPDGPVCGVIASRALARGAWVAPANETLRGVLALTPPIDPGFWPTLLEAQVNVVRQEARGFTFLSADTLSGDDDLRPINVRRLMSLLRRMALRLGSEYVFEPNGEVLRRTVERAFGGMLGDMFLRGAFAGATPAASYFLTSAAQEEKFIVEIGVAPSRPLTFLTVRLVQNPDHTLVVQET